MVWMASLLNPTHLLQTELQTDASYTAGAGLSNLGNTCYVNAVLQAVGHCEPVSSLLRASAYGLHGCACPHPDGVVSSTAAPCRACMVQKVLHAQLNGARNNVVVPTELVSQLTSFSDAFQPKQQGDRSVRLRIFCLHPICAQTRHHC